VGTQQSSHVPRSGQRSKVEPKMARRRSSDAGQCRRRWRFGLRLVPLSTLCRTLQQTIVYTIVAKTE